MLTKEFAYNALIVCLYPIYHLLILASLLANPVVDYFFILLVILRVITLITYWVYYLDIVGSADHILIQTLFIFSNVVVSVVAYSQSTWITSFQLIIQSIQFLLSGGIVMCCLHSIQPKKSIYVKLVDTTASIDDCVVCIEPLSVGQPVKTTCGHIFHAECMQKWISNHTPPSCPVCRGNLV
jgi:hypothetical protein